MGIFHTHEWKYVSVKHYYDKQYLLPGILGRGKSEEIGGLIPVTLILQRCKKCGEAKTKEIDGHWLLEELSGKD